MPGPELGKSGLFELNAGNPCMTSDALVDKIKIHGISQKSNKISLFNNGRGCNCASQATVWAEYPQKLIVVAVLLQKGRFGVTASQIEPN